MEAERQVLVFCVAGRQYALDVLDLREVGRLPPVTPEPGLPEGVVGVIHVHDRPVRVHDLGHVLRSVTRTMAPAGPESAPAADKSSARPPDRSPDRPWVIVSRGGSGAAREHYWRVDTVSDIVSYDPARVVHPDGDTGRPGILDLGGTLTYVLRPELLAESS